MRRSESGVAMLMALVTAGLLAALGISVLLAADTERRIAAHGAYGARALAAADAGLERALVDLRRAPDWTAVLNGGAASGFADFTRRPKLPSGGMVDLDAATTALQVESDSQGIPPSNAPRWRLFAWGALAALAPGAPESLEYVAVWVADDLSDADGDATADSNTTLTLHAQSYGPDGARRRVEATVAGSGGAAIRMISWREVR